MNGRTQLVLLDHGLYRQIDDAFREQYAGLWRALVFADKHGIKKHSEGMNAGEAYPLFAAMLTHKPWDQITEPHLDHLSLEGSKEEREMLQKNAQVSRVDLRSYTTRQLSIWESRYQFYSCANNRSEAAH
jgi:aarF domain-containing kinase